MYSGEIDSGMIRFLLWYLNCIFSTSIPALMHTFHSINCRMYDNWRGTFLVKATTNSRGEILVHQAKCLLTSGF